MKKNLLRILSLSLVVCLLIACIPSASAINATASKSVTFDVITCGDKIFWRTTTVTIKNNGTKLDQTLSIKNTSINCTVNPKSITLSPGGTATFRITTPLGKAGETFINVSPLYSGTVSCSITDNDNSAIFRKTL